MMVISRIVLLTFRTAVFCWSSVSSWPFTMSIISPANFGCPEICKFQIQAVRKFQIPNNKLENKLAFVFIRFIRLASCHIDWTIRTQDKVAIKPITYQQYIWNGGNKQGNGGYDQDPYLRFSLHQKPEYQKKILIAKTSQRH